MKTTTCLLAALSGMATAQDPAPAVPGAPPMPPPQGVPGIPRAGVVETIDASLLEEPIRWAFRNGSIEDEPVRTGPVAYLGVSASPASRELSAQLPIDPDTGLLVDHVAKDSPAEKAGLQTSDVLIKLDDQILIQARQLSVLVLNKKEGDSVKLTYIRKGQSQETSAVLGRREVQRLSAALDPNATVHGFSGLGGGPGDQADIMLESHDGGPLRTFVRRFNIPAGSGAVGGFGGADTTGSGGAIAGEMSSGGPGAPPPPPAPHPPDDDVKKELAEIRAMLEALQEKLK